MLKFFVHSVDARFDRDYDGCLGRERFEIRCEPRYPVTHQELSALLDGNNCLVTEAGLVEEYDKPWLAATLPADLVKKVLEDLLSWRAATAKTA